MPKDMAETASPPQTIDADICVIGAGSGGIALATAAAAFGQRVVLIEKHRMGGDGLNYGSVPANALLAAAHRAEDMRQASLFGIEAVEPTVNHAAVNRYIAGVIAAIAPNVSVERFGGMGIRVISAAAKFVNRKTIAAGEFQISARRFVIATGSSPVIPPIPGLADVPYFTNETIFDNKAPIAHLIVVGAGRTGLELAQAHRRLGSQVTVIDQGRAITDEDPELSVILLARLAAEGIALREDTRIKRISGTVGRMLVEVDGAESGNVETIEGTAVLIAAGRKANVADLGLDTAGIKVNGKVIKTNDGLRTTNKRVFAIGDAAGRQRYAHIAGEHADVVLRRLLFRSSAKTTGRSAPRVMFTEPALASVGLSEAEARDKHGRVNVLRWPYHENDRAQIEGKIEGHIKVVTTTRGQILGAAIVGAHAGELIQMWSLAISQRLNIKAMTEWISPYPTFSEINKRAAIRYFATLPSNPFLRKVIALLAKLG
ncbi:FAD-dependent oxidoreductase [Hyphomicrobium sp.]|uniref:dihydrolipoyl dehydrogenase family protein n=1 Tax=Hyphomicrobium sp. TaxID=82 RepID=UPI000F96CD55|nr:FAD-dependent oxidoreductase [Hyphomicrobium sp.]RUO99999.1 MAG: dihydrolipoamide dehydrogenase [Hyphomicrobium sp.]